jgi:hypothetical protein
MWESLIRRCQVSARSRSTITRRPMFTVQSHPCDSDTSEGRRFSVPRCMTASAPAIVRYKSTNALESHVVGRFHRKGDLNLLRSNFIPIGLSLRPGSFPRAPSMVLKHGSWSRQLDMQIVDQSCPALGLSNGSLFEWEPANILCWNSCGWPRALSEELCPLE